MNLLKLHPKESLAEAGTEEGLEMVIWGLTVEIMTSFTGGALLVGMALLPGAPM